MPYCKNDPQKSYKGDEPSPKGLGYCAHSENIGTVKNGKDGNKWIISSTSKGVKRWIKHKYKKRLDKNESSIVLYSEKESLKEKWWNDSNKCDCNKFVSYKRNPSRKYGLNYKDIHGLEFEKGKVYKFISYNNFSKKVTNIDQDAWIKYEIDKEVIKRDFCGSKKKLSKNNPIFKKINHSGYKIYFPYDNSGVPYAVYIKNQNNPIYIYRMPGKYSDRYFSENEFNWRHRNEWAYIQLLVKIIPQEIFIGKSKKLPLSKYYNKYLYGEYYDGNSVLVKIGNNKYVYIGTDICTFTSKNKIIKYVSMASISSNNIIPCATDIDNNYYLLQYNVFINKNNFNFLNNNNFYGNLEIYYFNNPDKFNKIDDYKLITSSFYNDYPKK